MGTYKEIEGDLIELALLGEFDVITHGCNCFCKMGAGIAPLMAKTFFANRFYMELKGEGDFNKLGQIESQVFEISENGEVFSPLFCGFYTSTTPKRKFDLTIVNSYTQYYYGTHKSNGGKPLDYTALRMCLKKINHKFSKKKIGLPLIGCGLAGGNWDIVKSMIQEELKDMDVTIVILPK